MKVRANRKGLLGLVIHQKGEEWEVERDQFRPYWMDALDAESREVEREMLASVKGQEAGKLRKEAAQLQARIVELEAEPPSKDKQGIPEDVL